MTMAQLFMKLFFIHIPRNTEGKWLANHRATA